MKKSWFFSLLAGGALALVLNPAALAQEHGDTVKVPEAEADTAPVPHTVTDPNTPPLTKKVNPKDGLTYVWLPPGKFQMGCSPGDTQCDTDEKPREVTISKGFWISTTPVTQAAYKRVMGVNPSFFKGDDRPVERVDWGDVLHYCTALGMRIPSEAEYEYAARAGNTSARYGELDDIAWYKDNSHEHTHPVAEKKPNAWGLYDMMGNVWEYTNDPFNPADPNYVAMRGGGWITSAQGIRLSFRGFDSADVHRKFSGFRCVGD
jgi:formylglycine-generating enzyme required for sulfatase activity